MKPRLSFPILFLLLSPLFVFSQKKAELKKIEAALRTHVNYLADDKLEGRRTGTAGEKLAMEYIAQQFQTIGLEAKGTEKYYQPFSVSEGKEMKPGTVFSVTKSFSQGATATKVLTPGTDYFVFPYSANGTITGTATSGLQEVGSPWLIDIALVLEDNSSNPHFDLPGYIYEFSKNAKAKGATAVLWYNSGKQEDKLSFNGKDRSPVLEIPVIYFTKKPLDGVSAAEDEGELSFNATIQIGEKLRNGYNVIGYIDNKAATTVVVGAHFDHLGYGEDGNSRYEKKEPAIHNGADDNASGTATLIELARTLKKTKGAATNYLFIAFSGEELGLYGSKYFTDHPTIDLKSINYMINMDMVGRLNDSAKTITVGGYGTSPAWASLVNAQNNLRSAGNLQIKIDSSGSGPSDHTSFYRKDIPVLFYFTGLHTDYHKPSDDADRINYKGMVNILQHAKNVIEGANAQGRLAFLKTREAQTTTTARFSVSMGIMPDYTYSGNGVRADGVSEGRPAQKAGLKAGDIVLQIGDYKVNSMESYMQTLGKFKKGDKATVIYQRGTEQFKVEIQF
ncbi:MAG: M28 family peptidase [Chitinophagaceae bacterium]|nr:M28 family peptidase [Chitinophagaceae bacterium]